MLEAFVRAEQEEGLAPKSILNHLMLLSGIFNHALKRGWCKHNPVQLLDKPRNPRNPDIRFLRWVRSRRSLLLRRQLNSAGSIASSTSPR